MAKIKDNLDLLGNNFLKLEKDNELKGKIPQIKVIDIFASANQKKNLFVHVSI